MIIISATTVDEEGEKERTDVERGAASGLEGLARVELGETKVGQLNLERIFLLEEQVLELKITGQREPERQKKSGKHLQVTVDNTTIVEVQEGIAKLACNLGGIVLRESLPLDNLLVEFAALHPKKGSMRRTIQLRQ